MDEEKPTAGDGPAATATQSNTNLTIARSKSLTKKPKGNEPPKGVAASVGSGGDAADLRPKPVPLPPPPIIDSLKYYSKQHAKLFGRGKLEHHGRKFPIEAAVRKLKQRGRARFVLERTWYSPLVSTEACSHLSLMATSGTDATYKSLLCSVPRIAAWARCEAYLCPGACAPSPRASAAAGCGHRGTSRWVSAVLVSPALTRPAGRSSRICSQLWARTRRASCLRSGCWEVRYCARARTCTSTGCCRRPRTRLASPTDPVSMTVSARLYLCVCRCVGSPLTEYCVCCSGAASASLLPGRFDPTFYVLPRP